MVLFAPNQNNDKHFVHNFLITFIELILGFDWNFLSQIGTFAG